MTRVNTSGKTKRFPLPAEIIPCNVIPIITIIEEFVDLFKDRIPNQVEDLQNEVDFIIGRNYPCSAEPVAYLDATLTMPLNLHILGVVHSSPVKVVVCIEPFYTSQKFYFGTRKSISDQDYSILPN